MSADSTQAAPTTDTLTLDEWALEAQDPVDDLVDILGDWVDSLDPDLRYTGADDLACDVLLDWVNRYEDLIRSAPDLLFGDAGRTMTALRSHANSCPGLYDDDHDILTKVGPLIEATSRAGLDLSPSGS